jgi:hypothetical protein
MSAIKRNTLSFFICVFFCAAPLYSANISLNNVSGKWQGGSYLFVLGRNYTASVVIYINQNEAYVFNGIYTVENKDFLRINISEMKSGPRSQALSKQGLIRTASSRFTFFASIDQGKTRKLTLRPKEIIIDGNNSDGYFEKEIILISQSR